MTIFTRGFYKDLAERAIATFAQAFAAILIAGGTGLIDADWIGSLSAAGMATLLAVLKAFAAAGLGDGETGASFGTSIPKASVAAVETAADTGRYEAEQAAPYAEGTPVDVIPDVDTDISTDSYGDHDHEYDGPAGNRQF